MELNSDALAEAVKGLPGLLAILDLAILLFCVFFFTSTLSSHVLEAFVGFINARGRQLRARLRVALGTKAADRIYAGPLIASLSGDGANKDKYLPAYPSYIEPELFARAVVAAFDDSEEINKSPILVFLRKEAGYDNEVFEKKLIEWFKTVNDRQNGQYTRWSFLRLFLVGFLFAGLLDIDVVQLVKSANGEQPATEEQVKELRESANALKGDDLTLLSADECKKRLDRLATATSQIRAQLKPAYAWQSRPGDLGGWLDKALGWLLAAIATSLGATFWFNLLSETLKLRAAGPKPKVEPTADEADGESDQSSDGENKTLVDPGFVG